MNCFDLQNHLSEYLDNALPIENKKHSDTHLAECKKCNEKMKHYRLILASIGNQPRSSLPIAIKRAPFNSALPRKDISRLRRTGWDSIPWYAKASIEGGGIVLIVLLGISAGPRIRAAYEKGIEQSLREFTESMNQDQFAKQGAPLARAKGSNPGRVAQDDFAGEREEEESSTEDEDEVTDGEIQVGNSEIWRFNLKSDNPHEIRPKIVQLLGSVVVSTGQDSSQTYGGIEAPGGIQFDLLVPKSAVPGLKKDLQKITPKAPEDISDTPMGETFTWYKVKSRKPIPAGQTRVVIWLSQRL
jgi:hypothetical protein